MKRNHIITFGIILKRTNYKEADKILTVYTDKLGKISILAKGIRKLVSKKRGHLELINHAKIELIEGKNWYIAIQAESQNLFTHIKSDYDKTKWAYYILECFDKLIPENEENVIIYNFLLKTLTFLNRETINSMHLANAYNLKLIKMLGFYAIASDFTSDTAVKNYFDKLASLKYEDLKTLSLEVEIINKAHKILSSRTQEIAEKEIKSLKSISPET